MQILYIEDNIKVTMSAVKAIKQSLTEIYDIPKGETEEIAKWIRKFIADPLNTIEDIEAFMCEELNMKNAGLNLHFIQQVLTSRH